MYVYRLESIDRVSVRNHDGLPYLSIDVDDHHHSYHRRCLSRKYRYQVCKVMHDHIFLVLVALHLTHLLDFLLLSLTSIKSTFSPLFCILELFGLAVTLSWIYLRVDLPSPAACRMGLLLVVVGLSINLSALVVKNYRIYRIFNSVSVINHAVSNRYLLRVVTIPVVITIVRFLE